MKLRKTIEQFALKLWQELAGSATRNVCISPISVQIGLLMLAHGANGYTKAEIARVLDIDPQATDEELEHQRKYLQSIHTESAWFAASGIAAKFEVANSIWSAASIRLRPEYVKLCAEKFGAQVEQVDFSSPKSLAIINNWTKERTHGKIDRLVDHLESDTLAVLANAVYFLCNWDTPFAELATIDAQFKRLNDTEVSVKMMNTVTRFAYSENHVLQSAVLPYADPRFCLYLFLPKTGNNFSAIYSFLSNPKWDAHFTDVEVELALPRFTFSWESKIKSHLEALGIRTAFTPQADFAQMAIEPLQLSEAIHKTFIKVDETGTEAAAVSAFEGLATGPPAVRRRVEMRVDRPFMFMLVHRPTMMQLFLGCVTDPTA